MGSVCVCLGEGNLLLLTPTSVLPCKAVRAAEATVSHSHIWHQSSESSTEAQAEDRRSSKKHEKVYVRTGQLSAITTACLEVRPPTLFLRTWSLTLNWKIYDYFSNLWIVESVCQTNFLFWCISYESTLEYAKLLHRSPAIPLLKQNLRYFYCHHTYCRLHSLFLSSPCPTGNIILAQ